MRFPNPAAVAGGLLLTLALAGTARGAEPGSPEARFKAGTSEWAEAYNAGDVERIVALYADDAVVMPPDAPATRGPAAIRAWLAQDIATSRKAGVKLRIDPGEGGSSGDLGWHSGTFTVLDGGGKTLVTGKYVETWQRRNGEWRLLRDIWNNDAPTAPAPPEPPVD